MKDGTKTQGAFTKRAEQRDNRERKSREERKTEEEVEERRRDGMVSEWSWDGEAVALGRVRGSDAYANRKEQISAACANQTPVLPGALLDRQHERADNTSLCTDTHIKKHGSGSWIHCAEWTFYLLYKKIWLWSWEGHALNTVKRNTRLHKKIQENITYTITL